MPMKLRRSPAAAAAMAATCRGGADAAAAEGVEAVTVRWLQYAGLQHLASPAASADQRRLLHSLLAQQGYGAQIAEGNQMLSSLLRNLNFSTQYGPDPYNSSNTTEQRVGIEGAIHGSYSPEFTGKLGTGLLDLHAMDDTELLSENVMAEPFDPSLFAPSRGASNDFDSVIRDQNLEGRSDSSYRASVGAKEIINSKEKKVAKIRVVVRKRPLSEKEISRNEGDIISVDENAHITIHEPRLKVDSTAYVEKHQFRFDAVLDENVTSEEIYRVTLEPIVPTILQQGKVTCFAFGQAGSGKTFTMQPLPLRASKDIFQLLHQTNYRDQNLKLWLSYFEIYRGKLFDLLSDRRKLCMREDGHRQVCIVGLQEFEVSGIQIVEELIQKGNSARITGSTGANDESSRSHAILQLTIKNHDDVNGSKRNSKKSVSKGCRLVGKISFIDLAGTECGSDSIDNDRIKRTEGAEISKSLLALKECIRALDNDQIHIPFRGSKLTEVLRDSFVGNSRTVMIGCVSPSTCSCEPTLNTLRYADRFKSLSNGSYSAEECPAISEEESSLASSLRFLVESEDIYEQNNEEAEDTTIFRRKIENNMNNLMPENNNNSFRLELGYNYSGREVGGTSSNVLEIYQHNRQNTSSSGYKTDASTQFSLNIYYKEKLPTVPSPDTRLFGEDKHEEQHYYSSKDCGSVPCRISYEKKKMHGSSSSTGISQYGEEGPCRDEQINTILEEEDGLISSHREGRESTTDVDSDAHSTAKSLSSELNYNSSGRDGGRPRSSAPATDRNEMQSTHSNTSTYQSDSATQNSLGTHESENVPIVSSPSIKFAGDETSEEKSNPLEKENGHIKLQICDPSALVNQYEEEAPSQDIFRSSNNSMPERDGNSSSFMPDDNSNERKEDVIVSDYLEMGQNIIQNAHACASNYIPDLSTSCSRPQEREINTILKEKDPRLSSHSEMMENSINIVHGVSLNNFSGTKDGGAGSPTLEMGHSTRKSDSSIHGSPNLHDSENGPTVSSPSRDLIEDEKSEKQIDSPKEDSAPKLSPERHDRCSNISVSQHEQEAPSQECEINPEEDALISAHVKVLENTMDIMHEEMNLLVEVDKSGSPIDKYVARLSLLLSRKAADLTNLQERLVKFQLRLQEHEILKNNNIQ